MYFENLLEERFKNEKLDIYVDMDGVIADYDIGNLDFLHKRPLKNNIKIFERLSKKDNITVHILSICRKDFQIEEKNTWLNKNAPFFKDRNVISKESHPNKKSSELKCEFLQNIPQKEGKIILVDDDNDVLNYIKDKTENIILFQDSSLQE